MKKTSAILLLVFLAFPSVVFPAVFTVDTTNDVNDVVPGDGICADLFGQCGLRTAVEETNALAGEDTVFLPRSTIYTLLFGNQLSITDSVTLSIASPAIPAKSVFELPQINGSDLGRVFDVKNATNVTFFGVYIRNGDVTQNNLGDQSGGGIRVDNVTNFNLLNSVVYSNRALDGGGIDLRNVSNVLINLSDISYNENVNTLGKSGIAIKHSQINAGTIKIQNSSIHHNEINNTLPQGCSAAVHKAPESGDMFIFNTSISDNGQAAFPNNCVDGVFAQSSSIFQTSDLFLINTNILNNSGVGIGFLDSGTVITGTLFVRNSIAADNAMGDCDSSMIGLINFGDASGGHNITSDSSCSLPAISGNMENTAPLLSAAKSIFPVVNFLFIYYEPLANSPAIDQGSALPVNVGNPNACQQFDQLLRVRPLDGDGNGSAICDIGAVEFVRDDCSFFVIKGSNGNVTTICL